MGHFGVRAVIGKGGTRDKMLKGCAEQGGVYLHAEVGAASEQKLQELLANPS